MIEPLRLSFEVGCPVEHAFARWTRGISNWWPADHTVSGDPAAKIVLELHLGGRIFERTPNGPEHQWGQVTHWEPPHRLGYLWHLRRDRAEATQVEIRFVAVGEALTRLEIEHTGWEALGTEAQTWRDQNVAGWTTLLPHFTAAATREENGNDGGRNQGRSLGAHYSPGNLGVHDVGRGSY